MNEYVKKKIIDNEKELLNFFKGSDIYKSIQQYIPKLNIINRDMDLYNFINASFKQKNKAEEIYNKNGFKSSRQLINESVADLDKNDITNINNLLANNKYTYLDICALSKNFNSQVGMYYLEEEDCVVIKTTVEDNNRPFDDRWLNRDKNVLIYCIQKEKEENVESLSFSHKPNAMIFNSLMLGELIDVHVFLNHKKGENYTYEGVFHPCGLVDGNNAFVLFRDGHDNEIPYDNFYGQLWSKLVKTGELPSISAELSEETKSSENNYIEKKKIIGSKRTALQQKKLELEISLRGDILVVQYEKNKLISKGRKDLAEKVTDVSLFNNQLGYDILTYSIDENGNPKDKHIIVKTSVNNKTLSYEISELEIKQMKNPSTDCYIYRVYDVFTDEPKYIDVTTRKSEYIPKNYSVILND